MLLGRKLFCDSVFLGCGLCVLFVLFLLLAACLGVSELLSLACSKLGIGLQSLLVLSGCLLQLFLCLDHNKEEGDEGENEEGGRANHQDAVEVTHMRHKGKECGDGEEVHLLDLLLDIALVGAHDQDQDQGQEQHACRDNVGQVGRAGVDHLIAQALRRECGAAGEVELAGITADQQHSALGDGVLSVVDGNDLALVIRGILCKTVVAAKRAGGGEVDALLQVRRAGQIQDAEAVVVYGVIAIGAVEGTGLQDDVAGGLIGVIVLGFAGDLKDGAAQLKCGVLNADDGALLCLGRVDDGYGAGGLDQRGVSRDHVTVQVKGVSTVEIVSGSDNEIRLQHDGAALTLGGGGKCLSEGFGLGDRLAVNGDGSDNGLFAGSGNKPQYGCQGKKRTQHE